MILVRGNASAAPGLLPPPSISLDLIDGDGDPNLIDGTEDADTINGLGGSDTLNGAGGNDTLNGGAAGDTLDGGEGADSLFGNAGQDDMSGGAGADTLTGGLGNDTYRDVVGDTLVEASGEGTDTVIVGATFSLSGISHVENLTLTGTGSFNATGNSLANVLTGNDGANRFRGAGGADTLIGGLGNDTYIDPAGATITELSGGGTDTVETSVTFSLIGLAYVDLLVLTGAGDIDGTGNTYNNRITGNAGNNRLQGNEGLDTLIGGLGNDTYVDPTGDIIQELSGGGTDTVETSVTFTLAGLAYVDLLVLNGANNINGTGNTYGNRITGNAGNNRLQGNEGIDTLIGGLGNDTYVDPTGDLIQEFSGEGTDTIESSVTFSLAGLAYVDLLVLTGADNINGTGNTYGNRITGNAGDNRLRGNDGTDTLIGGLGNDTFVDPVGDVIQELTSQGSDTVEVAVTFTLAGLSYVDNLLLTGAANVDGTGNTYANRLTGNAGRNRLQGAEGADTLAGGLGNDTYVDPAGDTIQENAGEGTDLVESAATFSLSGVANVENLTLTGVENVNATGSTGANIITGNAGHNRLRGGGGVDTLIGGLGDDIYADPIGAVITEVGGGGTDTVESSVTFTLSGQQQVENLTLTGASNINGTGNSYANVVTGNGGNNALFGNDGDDELIGGAGNDTFEGGAGADTLRGGLGNDVYLLQAGDIFVDLAGEGTDTIVSDFINSLVAYDHTENLTYTASGENSYLVYGNALNNILVGTSARDDMQGYDGNDTLRGGAGQESLLGGAGVDQLEGGTSNDFYFVDSADTVVELAGEGTDSVLTSGSYTLAGGSEVEGLSFSFFATIGDFDLTGNEFGQFISGNDGANRLSGRGGGDTLNGGLGVDTYLFSSTSHSTGTAFDTIFDADLDTEKFDLPSLPGSLNLVGSGNLFLATFDADLAAAVDGALDPGGAVQFTPSFSDNDLGGFGRFFLVVDRNGDGVYTAGSDIVIKFEDQSGTLSLDDFI